MPAIAKMLTEFTGQTFDRAGAHNLVRNLQKRFLVIDPDTGEEKVEFRGVQVHVINIVMSSNTLYMMMSKDCPGRAPTF